MKRFKKEVLEKIKTDPVLFGKVAGVMGIKLTSLGQVINRNGNSVNQYGVVTTVADHLGVDAEELVEPISEESRIQITTEAA